VGDQRIYPDMSDLWADNTAVLKTFNNTFFEELVILTNHLRKSGYKFHSYFKIADAQHIIDFPEGRACLGQWNIGFIAENDPARDSVRVGIGFRINVSGHPPTLFPGSAAILAAISAGETPAIPGGSERLRTNEALVEGSHKDYQNYVQKITLNQATFNSLFSGSLLYTEPFHLSQSPNFSQAVINDAKNVNSYW